MGSGPDLQTLPIFFLVEVIENLSLYSKELRVRARCAQIYSNIDRIMVQSGSKINLSSNRSEN